MLSSADSLPARDPPRQSYATGVNMLAIHTLLTTISFQNQWYAILSELNRVNSWPGVGQRAGHGAHIISVRTMMPINPAPIAIAADCWY